MKGINETLNPEFVDVSNYSPLDKVYIKQLERLEMLLIEIRDSLKKPAQKKRK
jgi:hypothetical protein